LSTVFFYFFLKRGVDLRCLACGTL